MPHPRISRLAPLLLCLLAVPASAQIAAGDVSPIAGELDLSTDPPTWRVQGDGNVDVSDVIVVLRTAVGLIQMQDDRVPSLDEVLAEIARLDLRDDALGLRVGDTETALVDHDGRLVGLASAQAGLGVGVSGLRADHDALQGSHDLLSSEFESAMAEGGLGSAALQRIDELESVQAALTTEVLALVDQAAARELLHEALQVSHDLLEARFEALLGAHEELVGRVDGLRAQHDDLSARHDAVAELLTCFERVDTELYVNACNLHVVNGTGATETPNGLGNLILGYNEERPDGSDERSGSHVLVVGRENGFRGSGGIVAGRSNDLNGSFASVLGGRDNSACADGVSISGGVGVATSLADSHPQSHSAGNGSCLEVARAVVTVGVDGTGNVHGMEFTLRHPPGVALEACQVAFAPRDCPAVDPAGPFAEQALQYVVNPETAAGETVVLQILADPNAVVPAPLDAVVRVGFSISGELPSLEDFELLEAVLSDELGASLGAAGLVLRGLEIQ